MRSNFRVIVSKRIKTNVVAPGRVKRENVSFPVAVRRSKMPLPKLPNIVSSRSGSHANFSRYAKVPMN